RRLDLHLRGRHKGQRHDTARHGRSLPLPCANNAVRRRGQRDRNRTSRAQGATQLGWVASTMSHWSDAYIGRPYIPGVADCMHLAEEIAVDVLKINPKLPQSHETSLRK